MDPQDTGGEMDVLKTSSRRPRRTKRSIYSLCSRDWRR